MIYEERPYQTEAKNAILSEWNAGVKKTLLVLPTGCGKTVVCSNVIDERVKSGGRVLFMAHRGELLSQASKTIHDVTGLDCSLDKASSSSLGSSAPVTVGSIQSLAQDKRLNSFDPDYFTDIIVDEATAYLIRIKRSLGILRTPTSWESPPRRTAETRKI